MDDQEYREILEERLERYWAGMQEATDPDDYRMYYELWAEALREVNGVY